MITPNEADDVYVRYGLLHPDRVIDARVAEVILQLEQKWRSSMATAEQVAQRMVDTGLVAPEHHKTLVDTLIDYAADCAYQWEQREWIAEPSGVRFGSEEDDVLRTLDTRGVFRIIAAHEVTRRRLSIVQSQLDQIRNLTEYE